MTTSYAGALMPPRIPADPLDLEKLPPDDIDDCPSCGGSGASFPNNDPQDVDVCHTCCGSGLVSP